MLILYNEMWELSKRRIILQLESRHLYSIIHEECTGNYYLEIEPIRF
jgi:hypothetical protein